MATHAINATTAYEPLRHGREPKSRWTPGGASSTTSSSRVGFASSVVRDSTLDDAFLASTGRGFKRPGKSVYDALNS